MRDDYIDATVQAAVRCQVLLQLGEGNRIEYACLNNDVQWLFHAGHLEPLQNTRKGHAAAFGT